MPCRASVMPAGTTSSAPPRSVRASRSRPSWIALGLRLTVLGTPAEEGGGGKVTLVKDGYFDDVHAALMVHPFAGGDVAEPAIIAVGQLTVTYLGRAAHAAAYPHTGINAADALVIAQTAIGLLRQQLLPTDRVHGIVVHGGDAPNIIPAETRAEFMVRGLTRERMNEVIGLVRRCFEAGALATGCDVEIVEEVPYSDMRHDHELAAVYQRQAEALGRTFGPASMQYSTDMGDVSYVVPAIHPNIGIDVDGAVNHQSEFAAACVTPTADGPSAMPRWRWPGPSSRRRPTRPSGVASSADARDGG